MVRDIAAKLSNPGEKLGGCGTFRFGVCPEEDHLAPVLAVGPDQVPFLVDGEGTFTVREFGIPDVFRISLLLE
jgi:hypothetical protein